MYADDSTLFCASPTLVDLNSLYLVVGMLWPIPLHSIIDRISVEQVTKTKLLGVNLDNLWFWSDQVDHIVSMMGKGIAVSYVCLCLCSIFYND